MTNIEFVGKENILIPSGYFKISGDNTVIKGDLACMVSVRRQTDKKDFQITWQKVDATDIGQPAHMIGEFIVRLSAF